MIYEIEVNNNADPYAENLKNCVNVFPFTPIMFTHFYLVDVRHFQNHRVVCFMALYGAHFSIAP